MSDLAFWTCPWCVRDFDDEDLWNEHTPTCPDRDLTEQQRRDHGLLPDSLRGKREVGNGR